MRVDASTAIGMNPSTGSVNKYTARFLYRHWRFVLGLFRDKAGPALDGFMKDFNKPDNNVSTPTPIAYGLQFDNKFSGTRRVVVYYWWDRDYCNLSR